MAPCGHLLRPGIPLHYAGDEQDFDTPGSALDGWAREARTSCARFETVVMYAMPWVGVFSIRPLCYQKALQSAVGPLSIFELLKKFIRSNDDWHNSLWNSIGRAMSPSYRLVCKHVCLTLINFQW